MKQIIRLTEGYLHRIVKEAVDNANNQNKKRWIPDLNKADSYLRRAFEYLDEADRAGVDEDLWDLTQKIADVQVGISLIIDRIDGDNIPIDQDPQQY